MGISASLPVARFIGPTSFVVNFIVQQIGMKMKPNMLDIHYTNLAAFSPYAYAIPVFFGAQQILQVTWLYQLFRDNSSVSVESRKDQLNYIPTYALGNLCISIWLLFWNKNRLDISQILVSVNSLANLYYVAFILPKQNSRNSLTHYVAKTLAGIGILDFLHNGSAAFFVGVPPSTTVNLTGVATVLSVASSDWILSSCIAYDLAALAIGQQGESSFHFMELVQLH